MIVNKTFPSILKSKELEEHMAYDPDRLLDTLIERFHLYNDAGLARWLEIGPPMISKVRNRRTPLSAGLLIRMHEVSDMAIAELCALMGASPR